MNETHLERIRRDLLASRTDGGLDYVDSMRLLARLDAAEALIRHLDLMSRHDSAYAVLSDVLASREAWERTKAAG